MTVSGYLSATGEIVATRLEPSESPGELLVSGFVRSLDTFNQEFSIGGLVVNYTSAVLQGFPSGSPRNGDRLVIRGIRAPGNTVLTASALRYQPGELAGTPGATASLHALVTSADSSSSVTVDGTGWS